MISSVHQGERVTFPAFTGERVYMHKFYRDTGLPPEFRRWQDTVDAMLDGIDSVGPVYLMIDQWIVRAGRHHRRPGVHVDNYWDDAIRVHGYEPPPRPAHSPKPRPVHGNHSRYGSNEAIVLASDVLGCRAFVGAYDTEPGDGGDASHVDLSRLDTVDLAPGRTWFGDTASLLHESIPQSQDCLRTVVRLNVTGWLQ